MQVLADEGVDLSYFTPGVYDDVLKGFLPLEEGASFNLSQKSQRRVQSPSSLHDTAGRGSMTADSTLLRLFTIDWKQPLWIRVEGLRSGLRVDGSKFSV